MALKTPLKRRRKPSGRRLLFVFVGALLLSAALVGSAVPRDAMGDKLQRSFGLRFLDEHAETIWGPILLAGFLGCLWWKYKPADMGNVIDVQTEQQLVDIMTGANGKVVLIDFTSHNCPYCDLIAPHYGRLSKLKKYKDKAIFLSLDVEKFQQVMMEAGVQATPTFVAYSNMKVLNRIAGPPADKLEAYFDQLILGAKKKKKKSAKSKAAKKDNKPAADAAAPADTAADPAPSAAAVADEIPIEPATAVETDTVAEPVINIDTGDVEVPTGGTDVST